HVFVRGVRILREQGCGGHQLTGRAEAALRRVFENEGPLQRVGRGDASQPFNRLHSAAFAAVREGDAGVDGLAVHVDGAGAAGAAVTDALGAREAQLVAEQVEQARLARDFDLPGEAIDDDVHSTGSCYLPTDFTSDTNPQRTRTMPYVITEACINVKDKSCVDVCPVDCIYEGPDQLFIQPDECIDCGACEPECPVTAIFPEEDVPANLKQYVQINKEAFEKEPKPGRPTR